MTQPNNLSEILEKMKEDSGKLLNFCLNAGLFDLNTVISSLIASKNAKHIYSFLICIHNFSFKDLVLHKVKIENDRYNKADYYQIEKEIIKEIASKLIDLLIETKSAQYIRALAERSKNDRHLYYYIDMDVLIEGILKTNDAGEIYSFALNILPNDIERFAKRIIELQDAMYIYYFAKNIPNAPINELMEAVIRTRVPIYIAMFALIPTTPTERLENEVILLNDAESIYFFAYNIKGASIEKLTEAMIATNDVKLIMLFAQKVDNAYLFLIVEYLMKLNAFDELVQIANQFPNYAQLISSFIIETKNPDILFSFMGIKDQSIKKKLQEEYYLLLEEKKREEENAPLNRLVALSQTKNFNGVRDEFELFQDLFSCDIADESWQKKLMIE